MERESDPEEIHRMDEGTSEFDTMEQHAVSQDQAEMEDTIDATEPDGLVAPPPPLMRREGGENPLSGPLIVSSNVEQRVDGAHAPLNEHLHDVGATDIIPAPDVGNEHHLVPTCLTEEVSALHTFDSDSSSDLNRIPVVAESEEVLATTPRPQLSAQPATLNDSSTSFDVPPPLPLFPSPPIRGAGGPRKEAEDGAAVPARPTVLISGPSRDDTIATSASMVQESSFVQEFGIDLDACMDQILHSNATQEPPAPQLVGDSQQQRPVVDQEQRPVEDQPERPAEQIEECKDEKAKANEKHVSYASSLVAVDPAKEKTLDPRSNHSGTESTSVLTEDELPAIITPPLRRQGSTATPGAYRTGGLNANNPTEPLPPPPPLSVSSSRSVTHSGPRRMTRQASTRVSDRRLDRSFSYDSVDDSCRTPVTATLVTDNDESQANISPTRREPVLVARAEPLEKAAAKRKCRCILAWALLAVVFASAVLGIFTAFLINREEAPTSQPVESPQDNDDLPEDVPLPDAANFTDLYQDIGMQSSSHTVMWGLVATCRDETFFNRYALDLQCGGELRILSAENADCMPRMIGDANITDTSRASCVIRGQPNQVLLENGRLFYQDITTSVIFECVGRTLMEHTATANLPPMEIENCSNEQQIIERRRRLGSSMAVSTHKASTVSLARSRALQEVLVGGGASSYMSMGRFCTEDGDWILWHEWYECEKGERFFFSKLFGVYNSEVPTVDTWVSGSGGVVLSTFLDAVGFTAGGDERRGRRHLQNIGDIPFAELASYIGAQSFCFSKHSCRSEEENCTPGEDCTGCSVLTDELIMSDYDPRGSCRWTTRGPDINEQRRQVADELDPEELVQRVAAQI